MQKLITSWKSGKKESLLHPSKENYVVFGESKKKARSKKVIGQVSSKFQKPTSTRNSSVGSKLSKKSKSRERSQKSKTREKNMRMLAMSNERLYRHTPNYTVYQ